MNQRLRNKELRDSVKEYRPLSWLVSTLRCCGVFHWLEIIEYFKKCWISAKFSASLRSVPLDVLLLLWLSCLQLFSELSQSLPSVLPLPALLSGVMPVFVVPTVTPEPRAMGALLEIAAMDKPVLTSSDPSIWWGVLQLFQFQELTHTLSYLCLPSHYPGFALQAASVLL